MSKVGTRPKRAAYRKRAYKLEKVLPVSLITLFLCCRSNSKSILGVLEAKRPVEDPLPIPNSLDCWVTSKRIILQHELQLAITFMSGELPSFHQHREIKVTPDPGEPSWDVEETLFAEQDDIDHDDDVSKNRRVSFRRESSETLTSPTRKRSETTQSPELLPKTPSARAVRAK